MQRRSAIAGAVAFSKIPCSGKLRDPWFAQRIIGKQHRALGHNRLISGHFNRQIGGITEHVVGDQVHSLAWLNGQFAPNGVGLTWQERHDHPRWLAAWVEKHQALGVIAGIALHECPARTHRCCIGGGANFFGLDGRNRAINAE